MKTFAPASSQPAKHIFPSPFRDSKNSPATPLFSLAARNERGILLKRSVLLVAIVAALGWLLCGGAQAQNSIGSQDVAMSFGTSPGATTPSSPSAPPVDKRQFTLFKPTPEANLRDINAFYNGPYTVDAGHLQTETVTALYAYDHNTEAGADVKTSFLSFGSTTFRLGLLNNLDLGVTFAPHVQLRTVDLVTGVTKNQSGIGDLTLRSKLNFWGDDSGSTAFGLVAFLKVPTSPVGLGNGDFEGGIGLPLSVELPKGWWLGVTPEFHIDHDMIGSGYHLDFASTLFLWHQIAGNLSGYVESSNFINTKDGTPWISTVDVGITYVWGKHVQFDAGAFIGVTPAANDISPFLGISFRF